MIKPILFVPCEQVLVAEQGTASLISIMENINIGGEIVKSLPENAGIPRNWTSVALWTRTAKMKKPTTYVSRSELLDADGKAIMGGTVEFVVSNKYKNFRNAINFPIFPIGHAGVLLLVLSYKIKGASRFKWAAEFPITVTHLPEKKAK